MIERTSLVLCGYAVPCEGVERLSASCGHPCLCAEKSAEKAGDGLATLAAAVPQGEAAVAIIDSVAEGEDISRAFMPPFSACLEVDGALPDTLDPEMLDTARAGGLYASLSTRTAYANETARLFVAGLSARHSLAEEQALNIEVALHEALANAMIHGNLEIPDISRETPGDLISSARAIDEALADEKLGGRPVVIAASWQEGRLVISVIDQGIGHVAAANRKPEVEGKNGRGLWIINLLAESVAVTDGGRRLTMRFGP
ncbi:MAG: ATP-binding protein [Rhodospirillales bacterium]|nr:ATP-binding protein [Rhodospirillales bacterium]MCW8952372.1 ATP-binding protein [Rhodospirillales bacterium]